ncbi:MAG: hypothetical protein ACYSUN_10050 [Planctomycetota bacterium]|jgi:hypothetical protein
MPRNATYTAHRSTAGRRLAVAMDAFLADRSPESEQALVDAYRRECPMVPAAEPSSVRFDGPSLVIEWRP